MRIAGCKALFRKRNMPFLLIPHEVTQRDAVVWLGIASELSTDVTSVRLMMNGADLPLGAWTTFTTRSNANKIHYQHVTAQGLQSGTNYVFELLLGDRVVTQARIRTLPDALESLGGDPFTILLGSCFCSSRSESVSLGVTYLNLQRLIRTDAKILCGDQVYLDDPALHFLWNTHSFEELEDLLFRNYIRTWSQMGWSAAGTYQGGYQQFLQNGANFFSSDDHEFWNNAPNWATLLRDTWSQSGRENWWEIASNLFRIFQSGNTRTEFNVGDLSFLVLDTRVNRDEERNRLLSDGDFANLKRWVNGLQGLGILVVGQPIFSKKSGWSGRFTDWSFPDYDQYTEILRTLYQTEHSIMVLTGDVHFGRIASVQIKDNVYLYEVISSPTALVDAKVGGSWSAAPERIPVSSVPGAISREVTNNYGFQFTANHFLTISFYKDGVGTRVVTNAVEVMGNGQSVIPIEIANFTLR